MKRNNMRLSISRETVRRLSHDKLGHVAGGTQGVCTVTCPNICSGACGTQNCVSTLCDTLDCYTPRCIVPSVGLQVCR